MRMRDPTAILDYGARDPQWFVQCSETADTLELRDPEKSLIRIFFSKRRDAAVLIIAPLSALVAVIVGNAVGMTDDFVGRMLLGIVVVGGCLCVIGTGMELYFRWRRPSIVCVQGAGLTLLRPAWSQEPPRLWDLREVTNVESVLGSTLHHGIRSVVMELRDGTKVSFLHCRNRHEAQWISARIQNRVDLAKGNVVKVDDTIPS
jgi:hypothetical protein